MPLQPPTRGIRARPRILTFSFVLTLVGTLLTTFTSCRVSQNPASGSQLSAASRQPPKPASPSSSNSLVCPPRGSSLVQEPAPGNAGHRVILSWKASAPPNAKHSAAFGYCIYRGKSTHDPAPQLINSTPFSGTRCMDDWVESTGKYTYLIRAISFRRVESDPSNVVSVTIPSGKQSDSATSPISAPLCRLPTAASK